MHIPNALALSQWEGNETRCPDVAVVPLAYVAACNLSFIRQRCSKTGSRKL